MRKSETFNLWIWHNSLSLDSCECERILDISRDAWKDTIFLHDWVLQKGLGDSCYWWSGRAE